MSQEYLNPCVEQQAATKALPAAIAETIVGSIWAPVPFSFLKWRIKT